MPYKRYMHNAVAALLLLSVAVYGEISIVNLKGMTSSILSPDTGVKKEFEEISPAVGALTWHCPFLKNVYIYAPEGDAVTRLVKELFYLHADGTFDVTRMHTKFGSYLDAETIGNMIGNIMLCRRERQPAACFMTRWHENIMPAFIAKNSTHIRLLESEFAPLKKEMQQLVQDQKMLAKKFKKSDLQDRSPAAIAEDPTYAVFDHILQHAIPDLRARMESYDKKLVQLAEFVHKHAREQDRLIASLIAQLLDEERQYIRPIGLTVCILLGFLWQRATSLDDLRVYLDAVAKVLDIPRDQLYVWPTDMKQYTRDDYTRLLTASNQASPGLSIDDRTFVPLATKVKL